MENTKRCPYCGEEILAVAKKCKYCGEWLDEEHTHIKKKSMIPCPVCGESIEEGTDVCPYCHEKIQLNEDKGAAEDVSDKSKTQIGIEEQIPIKKMVKCPICCEEIEEGTEVCPYCHEKIGVSLLEEKRMASNESLTVQIPNSNGNKDYASPDEQNTKSESTDKMLPSFFDYFFVEPLFRHYADFGGKISLKQYWMTVLSSGIICLFFYSLDLLFGTLYVFSAIYSLVLIIPGIAIGIRRLHDVGKSGWWMLIGLIPFIGVIVLIVFFCKEGESQCKKTRFKSIDTIISIVTALLVILSLFVFFHRNQLESSASEFESTEAMAAPEDSIENNVSESDNENVPDTQPETIADFENTEKNCKYYYYPESFGSADLYRFDYNTQQTDKFNLEELGGFIHGDESDCIINGINKAFLSSDGQKIIFITDNGSNGSGHSEDILILNLNTMKLTLSDATKYGKHLIELQNDRIKVSTLTLVREGDCEANDEFSVVDTYYDLNGNLINGE